MAQKEAELYASCMEDLANPALLDDAERAHLKAKSVALCGMTLRDYFAAKALPAIYTDTCERARVDGWPEDWRDEVAAEAYEMADAMLKAREQ